jgi:hypothetical protein
VAKPKQAYYWHVPIPYEVFMELSDFMSETRSRDSMGDLAGNAVRNWIADERRKLAGAPATKPSMTSGYQWKRLFLPDGTMLRTIFKGRPSVGQVADSQLVFQGAAISPHEFANSAGGSPRNAWKSIWLLFPGERDWKLADDCRPAPPSRTKMQSPKPT